MTRIRSLFSQAALPSPQDGLEVDQGLDRQACLMAFLCDGCKRVVSQANDEHIMISQFWKFAFPTLGCIAVQV
jgi:hypothetical protein